MLHWWTQLLSFVHLSEPWLIFVAWHLFCWKASQSHTPLRFFVWTPPPAGGRLVPRSVGFGVGRRVGGCCPLLAPMLAESIPR